MCECLFLLALSLSREPVASVYLCRWLESCERTHNSERTEDRTENKEETLSIRTPFARRRRRIGARSSGLADHEYIQYTHSTRERRIEGDKKRTKRDKRTRDNERGKKDAAMYPKRTLRNATTKTELI